MQNEGGRSFVRRVGGVLTEGRAAGQAAIAAAQDAGGRALVHNVGAVLRETSTPFLHTS